MENAEPGDNDEEDISVFISCMQWKLQDCMVPLPILNEMQSRVIP